MVRVLKVDEGNWEAYMELRHHVFCVEKDVPEDIQVDQYDTLDGICDHFLLCRGDEPLGAFRCRRDDDRKIQLQRFCVLDRCRRQGLGRIMLEYARDYYAGLGYEIIAMEAKYTAKPFYESCGCITVSDIFMEVGLPHVNMILQLHS